MKFSEIDWSVLRGSFVLLIVSILVAGAALSASYRFWSKQDIVLKRAQSALSSASGQYHALDDEENIIATYLPRYTALEEEGIIGREQRLDWIDVLRETARTVKVPHLEYAIEAQQPFDLGMDLGVGDYSVFASNMSLTLGLLHEEDLVRFFVDLSQNASGLFGVTGCEMSRSAETLSNQPQATNISASCVLKFITIRGPESPSGAKS